MTSPSITVDELATLLVEAGHHHHQAYEVSDGADPEWPLWYAGWLQAHLWDRAGSLPSRSQLVHLLLAAERHHGEADEAGPWPEFYAALILRELEPS